MTKERQQLVIGEHLPRRNVAHGLIRTGGAIQPHLLRSIQARPLVLQVVEDVNVGEGASQAGDVQLPDPHHKLESTLAHNRVDLDLRPVGHPVSAPSQSDLVPRAVPIPSHSVRNQTPGKRLRGLQAVRLEPEDGAHLAFMVNQTARGFVQR